MDRPLEEFIETSVDAATVEEVSAAFHGVLARFGFDGSAFGQYQAGALTGFLWDRLPGDFSTVYREQNWDRVDPLLYRGARRAEGFFWRSETQDRRLSRPQQDFLAELRARGIRQGVMIPVHGPGARLELCGATTERKDPLPPRLLRTVQGLVMQASLSCARTVDAPTPRLAPRLSKRELECLKWLRDNKSNWEISQILKISEKTVEFHVGNLLRKLGADGRLDAVLKGIREGLLQL